MFQTSFSYYICDFEVRDFYCNFVNGKVPDGRHVMTYARNESNKFFKDFYVPVSGRTLCDRLSLYLNAYTLYNAVRPFGSQ